MANIIHRVGIKAPAQKVYQALSTLEGVGGWWSQEVSGASEEGKDIKFVFRSPEGEIKGSFLMKVTKHSPNQFVEWRCVEGPAEWIGTNISFKLAQEGEYTIVLFAHRNWKEEIEFMAHCSMKWAIFLLSLRDLVEKGKGQPSPMDVKIDNWN